MQACRTWWLLTRAVSHTVWLRYVFTSSLPCGLAGCNSLARREPFSALIASLSWIWKVVMSMKAFELIIQTRRWGQIEKVVITTSSPKV